MISIINIDTLICQIDWHDAVIDKRDEMEKFLLVS